MKKKHQNIFLLFGLAMLVIMVVNLNFGEVWQGLKHAGYWFFAVLALWAFLYGLNTMSWRLILLHLSEDTKEKVPFWWLYKITISGFALNYTTPGGLMGGEAYRIMELAPRIGTEHASSAVILYVMTHIFSHMWFWLLPALLFVAIIPLNIATAIVMLIVIIASSAAIWLFIEAYRNGLAVKLMSLLNHIPIVKRWALPFTEKNHEVIERIDREIASLHKSSIRTLISAVLLELLCRIVSALEVFFILKVIMPDVNFIHCILILAFTSLFANLLFFMPLQLGGREGGFLMSSAAFGITASTSIFLALIVRLRELVWTGIGIILIRLSPDRSEIQQLYNDTQTYQSDVKDSNPTE